jgi:hypothetical protein
MTGVTLGQSVVLMLLFTVHGHVRPIGRSGCRGEGPVASCFTIGLHASLGRGRSTPRGSGAPVLTLQGLGEVEIVPDSAQGSSALMTSWGSGEAEIATRGAYLTRDPSARLKRDGGWLSALSD